MRLNRPVPFIISSVDGLGQGVSKVTDKITFLAKTLPGDEGLAEVFSEKKGVAFAEARTLTKESLLRKKPECPHFSSCPSCHYFHTNYENELSFKAASLEKLFQKIPHPPLEVIGAPKRTHYRNRIQLHYDLSAKKLGMLDARKSTIVEVPLCIIANDAVTQQLKLFYQNENWLTEAPAKVGQGHVEIYDSPEGLKISWNKPYSEGGFTQVFEEMNRKLKAHMQDLLLNESDFHLLDLFAGNGNLSEKLNYSKRLCVDIYNQTVQSPFVSQDLYAESALKKIQDILKKQNLSVDILLLDPPRSGLKNLAEWVEVISPRKVVYISCDPHTFVRDIATLKNYQVASLTLVDFFPSTFHFESFAILERK